MSAVFDELRWRGLVANSTDEAALAEHLDAGPVTFYVGFDPTAPSIHIGNLVQLMVARALQRAGHRPLLLVGGSTGLIGDPKAAGERVLNSKETVAGWVASIQRQVERSARVRRAERRTAGQQPRLDRRAAPCWTSCATSASTSR